MSFAKYSIQTVLVRSSLILFGLATGIINSRWLGPEGVGIIVLLALAKNFAFRFGNLGFGSAIAFYVAKKEISASRILWLVWLIGGIVSIVSCTVLLAVRGRDFSLWNDIQAGLFYLCLPSIPLKFFNSYLIRVLSGELRIGVTNIANMLMSLSNVVFLVVLVIVFGMGVTGAILSVVLSDMATFFYLALQFREAGNDTVETEEAKVSKMAMVYRLWRYGRWNYLLMFSNFLVEELPMMLLKSFSANNVPVGLFSRARGLGQQSRIVALPVSNVLFPYTAASEEKKATNRTNILCRNLLVVVVVCIGLMALFIKPIILVLYGEAFLPAAKIFYALASGFCLWPLGHFLAVHVAAFGRSRAAFFTSLCTVPVAAVTCWLLIPRYGAVGAGLSVSIIYTVWTLLRLVVYVRITGASFSEILFPRRSDLAYGVRVLKNAAAKFIKTTRIREN